MASPAPPAASGTCSASLSWTVASTHVRHPQHGAAARQGTYLEVVEVLDHPASDKAPFGQAVRARSELGGGWLGWVVAVDDIAPLEAPARPRGRAGQPATVPTATSCAGSRSASRASSPTRSCRSSCSGRATATTTPAAAPPATSTSTRSRSPATRTGSASGSAPRSRARSRTSRSSGSAATAPPASSPRSSARPRARPDLTPAVPTAGAIPSPEHLGPPRRPTSSRTAPSTPTASSRRAMRAVADWAGRDVLDVGCGTGFHLPRFAATARAVTGVEPHPAWSRSPAARTRRLGDGHRAGRAARSSCPLPDASVDVAHARWAYFFGPGCEPGLASSTGSCAAAARRSSSTTTRPRSTFGALVPARLPDVDPDAVERFWSGAGLVARRRSTRSGGSRLAGDLRGRRAASSSTRPTRPTRSLAEHDGVRRWTTPSTCGGGGSDAPRDVLGGTPCSSGVRITCGSSLVRMRRAGPRAAGRSATATSSSGWRTEVSRRSPARRASRRSRPPRRRRARRVGRGRRAPAARPWPRCR